MKKSTKKTIRNVGIGAGVIAALSATAYALKDNKKVKSVVKKIKNEVTREFRKITVKNAKR
jgi:ABC-type taurine transport system substrate-binding protein